MSRRHGTGTREARAEADSTRLDPMTRLGDLIEPSSDGCWIWRGNVNSGGYGEQHVLQTKPALVHRALWVLLRGPIPKGEVLHHECRVPACCNPDHLTPMSRSEHRKLHVELDRAG